MKKLILITICLFFAGCATSQITTDIGTNIGMSFQQAAGKGIVSAEQAIKVWPYISGQLKGVLSENYTIDISPIFQKIVKRLDTLAKKKKLTMEEKGFVIGSFVRLEQLALKNSLPDFPLIRFLKL